MMQKEYSQGIYYFNEYLLKSRNILRFVCFSVHLYFCLFCDNVSSPESILSDHHNLEDKEKYLFNLHL